MQTISAGASPDTCARLCPHVLALAVLACGVLGHVTFLSRRSRSPSRPLSLPSLSHPWLPPRPPLRPPRFKGASAPRTFPPRLQGGLCLPRSLSMLFLQTRRSLGRAALVLSWNLALAARMATWHVVLDGLGALLARRPCSPFAIWHVALASPAAPWHVIVAAILATWSAALPSKPPLQAAQRRCGLQAGLQRTFACKGVSLCRLSHPPHPHTHPSSPAKASA